MRYGNTSLVYGLLINNFIGDHAPHLIDQNPINHVGKTMDVIIHVQVVQKPFKAQLQVVKKPNGMGEQKKVS